MSLRFRQATPEDAPAILAIKQAAIQNIAGWYYTPDQIDAWTPDESALSTFEAAIESERYTVLLAEVDGDTAAYGGLNWPEKRIDAAFVDPDHERAGIGSSLIRQLESRAQMRGIQELDIVSSKNAREFYEGLGYWHFDTKKREIGETKVEFAVMHKRLQGE